MTRDDACRLLDVKPSATLRQLKARWRALAMVHHPDHGGDPTMFRTYLEAYEIVKASLTVSPPFLRASGTCPLCHGTGFQTRRDGFFTLSWPCASCATK